jgi:Fe-S cluster assembly protein SufD
MIYELRVPQGATMIYEVSPQVSRFECYIEAHAQVKIVHASARKEPVHYIYRLQEASRLDVYGWYEDPAHVHLEVVLQGESAHAEIKLGFKGYRASVVSLETIQRHEAPRTTSALVYKSLLAESAQTVHTGMIYIAPEATHTDARLHSNHMLMNDAVKAYVQPNLEVLTNEVHCAHGSAIGMFDEEMFFYMQARGIDRTVIVQLLEEAFLAEVR